MHKEYINFRKAIFTLYLPRFGMSLLANILIAVDLPIPFVPTKPRTCPGLGTGSLQVEIYVRVLKTDYQTDSAGQRL